MAASTRSTPWRWVRAFAADTGAQIWEHQVRGENSPRETLYGGGVSFDNDRLYVTNGAGDVAALDAATGNQIWMVKPGGPLRGSPTIGNDTIWVLSQDSQLYALSADTGERRWNAAGSFELSGVFGAASPAFAQSTLVAGFSSGELTAYRYENGQVTWQDALARTGISTTVQLSDIDADPVIEMGRFRDRPGGHGRGRADHRPAGLGIERRGPSTRRCRRMGCSWSPTGRNCSRVARSSARCADRAASALAQRACAAGRSLAGRCSPATVGAATARPDRLRPRSTERPQTIEHASDLAAAIVAQHALHLDDSGRLTVYRKPAGRGPHARYPSSRLSDVPTSASPRFSTGRRAQAAARRRPQA